VVSVTLWLRLDPKQNHFKKKTARCRMWNQAILALLLLAVASTLAQKEKVMNFYFLFFLNNQMKEGPLTKNG
jgi:hypothetical protein